MAFGSKKKCIKIQTENIVLTTGPGVKSQLRDHKLSQTVSASPVPVAPLANKFISITSSDCLIASDIVLKTTPGDTHRETRSQVISICR